MGRLERKLDLGKLGQVISAGGPEPHKPHSSSAGPVQIGAAKPAKEPKPKPLAYINRLTEKRRSRGEPRRVGL